MIRYGPSRIERSCFKQFNLRHFLCLFCMFVCIFCIFMCIFCIVCVLNNAKTNCVHYLYFCVQIFGHLCVFFAFWWRSRSPHQISPNEHGTGYGASHDLMLRSYYAVKFSSSSHEDSSSIVGNSFALSLSFLVSLVLVVESYGTPVAVSAPF